MRSKHTHKYHRVPFFLRKVWACALPDCSHYMPNHLEPTLPGKKSICWQCEGELILDAHNMSNDKPLCNDCNPTIQSIGNMLEHFGVK